MIILLTSQKHQQQQRLSTSPTIPQHTHCIMQPWYSGMFRSLFAIQIQWSLILVWPMTYATWFELVGTHGLLPYKVGSFPTLHRIQLKLVIVLQVSIILPRNENIFYNMIRNRMTDGYKWTDQVALLWYRRFILNCESYYQLL